MTDKQEKNKYFYDFGDTEPNLTEELPKNIEEFNRRVEAKKKEILKQHENQKKIQQLKQLMSKEKE